MKWLLHDIRGVTVRHDGCEHCGRGVDRVTFTTQDGEEQVLTGLVAEVVWDDLNDAANRRRARSPDPSPLPLPLPPKPRP